MTSEQDEITGAHRRLPKGHIGCNRNGRQSLDSRGLWFNLGSIETLPAGLPTNLQPQFGMMDYRIAIE
jgi:hypothetical protein